MQSLGTAQSPIMKVTNVMTSGAMPIPQLTSAFPPGPLDLRLDQQEALDTITSAYARGMRRALVGLPIGTAKTITFAHQISQRRGRALLGEHRDELIRQAVERLWLVNPAMDIDVVKAECGPTSADRRGA
jgi:superfamily II DNA or RNA helicase